GSILAGLGACAVGLSLAELASIDPTVGAQFRWSANLAPAANRFWGLMQGWITTAAWCFASGGPPSILANMITWLAVFNNPAYEPARWHTSLVMVGTMVLPFLCNLWFRKFLDAFEVVGGILHVVLFVVFVAVLAAPGQRSSTDYVFRTLTWDVSGWNNPGVSWGLGLLTVTFFVTGFDSVIHMCDEVKKAQTRVPRSVILACTINSAMLFVSVTVLLFYIGPLEKTSTASLLIYVVYHATGSKTAANTLVSLVAVVIFLALFNMLASVSRLVLAFAKDNGLPFSSFFSRVQPHFKLPMNALMLLVAVVVCLSLVLGAQGIPINLFALAYLVYVVVWMPFPQVLPVTGDNMNYAGPIFGAVLVGALIHYLAGGREKFRVPVTGYE
ncbi:LPXTG-domain-containing protein, partial [Colletotrichum musicola]